LEIFGKINSNFWILNFCIEIGAIYWKFLEK
jgi:hypothetical protein